MDDKIKLKLLIKYGTLATVALLFGSYFFFNIKSFSILSHVDFRIVALLFLINIASMVSNGLQMKWTVAVFDKSLNLLESFNVSLVSSVSNFFAPAGSGLAVRAVYLKKRFGLNYSDYTSIVFVSYLLLIIINSILGIAAISLLGWNEVSSLWFGIFLILILCLASVLMIKKNLHLPIFHKFQKYIEKISSGNQIIMKHKLTMQRLILITIINYVILAAETYLSYLAIGAHISFSVVMLLTTVSSLSLFINITPANLGIKEAIYLLLASSVSLTAPIILSSAIIDRSVLFLSMFIAWLFSRSIQISSASKFRL